MKWYNVLLQFLFIRLLYEQETIVSGFQKIEVTHGYTSIYGPTRYGPACKVTRTTYCWWALHIGVVPLKRDYVALRYIRLTARKVIK